MYKHGLELQNDYKQDILLISCIIEYYKIFATGNNTNNN